MEMLVCGCGCPCVGVFVNICWFVFEKVGDLKCKTLWVDMLCIFMFICLLFKRYLVNW